MNNFQKFVFRLQRYTKRYMPAEVEIYEPLRRSGRWTASIFSDDEYTIEVEWAPRLGFGLVAGKELDFGTGVHEVFGSPDATFERVRRLLKSKEATRPLPLSLSEIRKGRRVLQKDVAVRAGVTKGFVSQLENSDDIGSVQIATLRKILEGLGGELVLSVRFGDEEPKQIAMSDG